MLVRQRRRGAYSRGMDEIGGTARKGHTPRLRLFSVLVFGLTVIMLAARLTNGFGASSDPYASAAIAPAPNASASVQPNFTDPSGSCGSGYVCLYQDRDYNTGPHGGNCGVRKLVFTGFSNVYRHLGASANFDGCMSSWVDNQAKRPFYAWTCYYVPSALGFWSCNGDGAGGRSSPLGCGAVLSASSYVGDNVNDKTVSFRNDYNPSYCSNFPPAP